MHLKTTTIHDCETAMRALTNLIGRICYDSDNRVNELCNMVSREQIDQYVALHIMDAVRRAEKRSLLLIQRQLEVADKRLKYLHEQAEQKVEGKGK